jgi:hypothetical protein
VQGFELALLAGEYPLDLGLLRVGQIELVQHEAHEGVLVMTAPVGAADGLRRTGRGRGSRRIDGHSRKRGRETYCGNQFSRVEHGGGFSLALHWWIV